MNQAALMDESRIMPLAVATGLFKSLCTIQAPDGAVGTSGAPGGTYADVAGLVNIVCMDAPETFGAGISATEIKALAETASIELRHVLLDKCYALLSPETNWGDVAWRAVVDNVIYDVLGAEADSQRIMTRLKLRKVHL
jgi:hypothetical protein